ncbi:MAG: hypothetical protein ABSD49_14200 [Candidatus Bathyarchaeia archaeon]
MKHISYIVLPFLLVVVVFVSAVVPGFSSVTTMGSLDLSPSRGPVGIDVEITGQATTNVTNLDQSCTIFSPSNPAIITAAACVVNGDGSTSGNFTGSFTVGNVPLGEYVIEVTACAGNNGCVPSKGNWVQTIFVLQGSPTLTALFAVAYVPSGYYELTATGNTGDSANAVVGA